ARGGLLFKKGTLDLFARERGQSRRNRSARWTGEPHVQEAPSWNRTNGSRDIQNPSTTDLSPDWQEKGGRPSCSMLGPDRREIAASEAPRGALTRERRAPKKANRRRLRDLMVGKAKA